MKLKKLVFLILTMIPGLISQSFGQEDPVVKATGILNTVNGPVFSQEIKLALTHEHIMSNFGAEINKSGEYDEAALFTQVIPYLNRLKSMGVQTIFDCTANYFGRRADLLQEISDSTGIRIVTNTGIYGAAKDRYVPDFAYSSTVGEIAGTWIREFENGIDGTEIKPGFVKLAFDEGSPSEIDLKLFKAGILTHLATGLTLAVHTSNNPEAAAAQMKLLAESGISHEAWVWGHANFMTDVEALSAAAEKGAWISLDGVNSSNTNEYLEKLSRFKSKKLLHKVLLSHDGNGYPRGGAIRQFDAIFTTLIPAMLDNGFTQSEIDQILIENPKNAFEIRVRETSKGIVNY